MPENDYDSSRILCRRCLERDVSAQELRAYLKTVTTKSE